MKNRLWLISTLSIATAFSSAAAGADSSTQNVTVANTLQIPGASLEAGNYVFSVEDRLSDRAIVRITKAAGAEHFLLLAVPNPALTRQNKSRLILFTSPGPKGQALKAWACAKCPSPLELVYPKLEAASLTGTSGQSVLAVDPTYDKLPQTLSQDDMKVVTLWLLSPERITASRQGEGLKAVKYAERNPAPSTETAAAQAVPEQTAASNVRPARHLPKTASNTFSLALYGFLLIGAAGAFRVSRLRVTKLR